MNKTIALMTIHKWRSNYFLLLALLIFFLFEIVKTGTISVFYPESLDFDEITNTGAVFPFLLALGTGIIGGETQSGTITLTLSHAVRRCDYVLTKWLTLSFTAFLLSLLQLAIQFAFVIYRDATLYTASDMLSFVIWRLLLSLAFGAVMIFFSSVKSGNFAGTGVWVIFLLISGLFSSLASLGKINPKDLPNEPFFHFLQHAAERVSGFCSLVYRPIERFLVPDPT